MICTTLWLQFCVILNGRNEVCRGVFQCISWQTAQLLDCWCSSFECISSCVTLFDGYKACPKSGQRIFDCQLHKIVFKVYFLERADLIVIIQVVIFPSSDQAFCTKFMNLASFNVASRYRACKFIITAFSRKFHMGTSMRKCINDQPFAVEDTRRTGRLFQNFKFIRGLPFKFHVQTWLTSALQMLQNFVSLTLNFPFINKFSDST
eukprot:03516_3